MTLVPGVAVEFNQHFAAWARLEPRCRRDDFARGLQACTADPLWMVGRQWQTGELLGEDAASPIKVRVDYATRTLGRVKLGVESNPEPLPSMPLETLVEQERLGLSWRDRVQIGQQFERLIRGEVGAAPEDVISAYREHKEGNQYVFRLVMPSSEEGWTAIDRATRRFVKLANGRVVDGAEILKRIDFGEQDTHRIPVLDGISAGQLGNVVSGLKSWCRALNIGPQPTRAVAWRNPSLDYRFAIDPPEGAGPATQLNLVAPEYRNGDLDWYTFNVAGEVPLEWTFTSPPPHSIVPKRASVGGTSTRWWEFEDAATDFGSVEASRPDLARLLLMEYVLIHGDDWYVVPLTVQMPCVVCVGSVLVTNVFGETLTVRAARKANEDPLRRFDLFSLSQVADGTKSGIVEPAAYGAAPEGKSLLLIPPVAGYREESHPLEEVRFLRDEGANKVWAVEHIVRNGVGRPVDGFDAQGERHERILSAQIQELGEEQSPSNNAVPKYRLATTVPDNWFPFAPFNAQPRGHRVILRRAQMLRNVEDEQPSVIPAMSRLLDLDEDPLLWIEELAVARSGVRVHISGQRLRWVDGKTYVWRGRKVLTGRGEGSSGLRFDVLQQGT